MTPSQHTPMLKGEEIPADIRKAAQDTLMEIRALDGEPSWKKVEAIAATILDERQRCKKIAFDHEVDLREYPNQQARQYYAAGALDMALGIAAAIESYAAHPIPSEANEMEG